MTDPTRLREAFDRLAPLSPAARDAELERVAAAASSTPAECAAFAGELRALLAQFDRGETTLDRPVGPSVFGESIPRGKRRSAIGGFAIVDELGAGGSSTVYAAVDAATGMRAAIKVLHADAADGDELRRFEREIAILSRFAHPWLARVLGSGTFEVDGRVHPYLAMELIDGSPLDAWCRDHSPALAERVRILIEIAEGVHHAHTCGVVHRDLKPANIMVDGEGHPRIIDFGVARWTGGGAARTRLTARGDVVGTLSYLSPEQASDSGNEVDARSDVYALGLIAYELFAGHRARDFDFTPLHAALRRVGIEEAAQLPATPGDPANALGRIVANATRHDPRDRYVSAQAFADDLSRFLRGEAVMAPNDDAVRRIRRRIRRYRVAIALVVLLAAFLGGSAYVAVVGRREARAKEAHARGLYEVLRNALVPVDPSRHDRAATVKDLLDSAAASIEQMADPPPQMEDEIRVLLARAYENLHDPRPALEQWERVLELRRASYPSGDRRIREAAAVAARRRIDVGDFEHARTLLESCGLERTSPHSKTIEWFEIDALRVLAQIAAHGGDTARGADLLEPLAIAQTESARPTDSGRVLVQLDLGGYWRVLGRFADARAIVESTYEALRADPAADPRLVFNVGRELVELIVVQGRPDVAGPLAQELVSLAIRLHGERGIPTLDAKSTLASVQGSSAQYLDAAATMREVVATAREIDVPRASLRAYAIRYSLDLKNAGCLDDAAAVLREFAADDDLEEPIQAAAALVVLGELYKHELRFQDAHDTFAEADRIYARAVGAENPNRAGVLYSIATNRLAALTCGVIVRAQDGPEPSTRAPLEAIVDLLREADQIAAGAHAEAEGIRFEVRLGLGVVLAMLERYDEAEPIVRGLIDSHRPPEAQEAARTTLEVLRSFGPHMLPESVRRVPER